MKAKTLLVVQDDLHSSFAFRKSLEQEGYQVETARDFIEAAQKMDSRVPDGIILDQQLLGPEWLSLRAKRGFESAPLFVLVDRGGLKTLLDVQREFPVAAWLEKPVFPAVLTKTVQEVIR